MSLRSNVLPLFYDAEGKNPVPYRFVNNRVEYEVMKFPSLDEGQAATTRFYVRNASMGVIEDFTVEVESVNKPDVTVQLTSVSSIQRMAVKETYHGSLHWVAKEGVPAGPCLARISVEGMLTQE